MARVTPVKPTVERQSDEIVCAQYPCAETVNKDMMIRHVFHRMHGKPLFCSHPREHQNDDKIDCKKQRDQPEGHTDAIGENKESCESDNDTPECKPNEFFRSISVISKLLYKPRRVVLPLEVQHSATRDLIQTQSYLRIH